MALPVSAFVPADSIYAGLSVIQLKIPAGGSVQVFATKKLDDEFSMEKKSIMRPDVGGILRKVRTQNSSEDQNWKFELDEAKRLLLIFTNQLAGSVTGTCTLWIPDPLDDATHVALKSEVDFPCTITREGGVTFGNGDFTIPIINIESNKLGRVTFTKDVVH